MTILDRLVLLPQMGWSVCQAQPAKELQNTIFAPGLTQRDPKGAKDHESNFAQLSVPRFFIGRYALALSTT